MYSPNFRSYVRTLLRQEASKYDEKDGIPIPEVAQSVTEQLRDRPLRDDEKLEATYALVYDEAQDLFKHRVGSRAPLQIELLIRLGVPKTHASLLAQINEDALQVPCEDGRNRCKPLYGKERMSRGELGLAKAYLRRKGEETIAKADLVDELYQIPGYYK